MKKENPPLLVLEFLNCLYTTIQTYIGVVSEVTVKDNFSVIYQVSTFFEVLKFEPYETVLPKFAFLKMIKMLMLFLQLLEEMLVNGFPTTTEMNVLTEIITPPSFSGRVASVVSGWSAVSDQLPKSVVTSTPWRKRGVTYRSNEILFDVTEVINATVNSSGTTVRSSVFGTISCSCQLSGMPELSLSFNDYNSIEDVKFHPCVRLNQWKKGHNVSFIPPDGKF